MRKRKEYEYIPVGEIDSIETTKGEVFTKNDILDGAHIRKRKPKVQPKTEPKVEQKPTKIKWDKAAEQIMSKDGKIWDDLNIRSGSQLYSEEDMQKQYISKLEIIDDIFLSSNNRLKTLDELTDNNYHSVRNYLDLKFGDKKARESYKNLHKDYPTSYLNPKLIEAKFAYGGSIGVPTRTKTLEEKAEDLVGSSQWHSFDAEGKSEIVAELVSSGALNIEYGLGGRTPDKMFENGEIVWDENNKRYGVVLNNYENKDLEIRLDSDGNQSIEWLYKLGSVGDKGTKEDLQEALLGHKSLIETFPDRGYERVAYANGGGVDNVKKIIDGYNVWYLTYIDSTHFFLSNSPDFKGNAYHIGQFRGRPFYDEVNQWLKSFNKSYAKGGGVDAIDLKAGVYRIGNPKKIEPNLYEQKIMEIFEDGSVDSASDYGRKLSDFSASYYKNAPVISDKDFAIWSIHNQNRKLKYANGGNIEVLYTKLIKEFHKGGYENMGSSFKSFIETKKETALEKGDLETYHNLIDVLDMYENDFYAKGGGVAEAKYKVTFEIEGNKRDKLFDSKEKADNFLELMADDEEVKNIVVEEVKATPTESLFAMAKSAPAKKSSSKEKESVQVNGIATQIARYDQLKEIIDNAKAEQELLGGSLKQIGKDKFLEIYEKRGGKPDNFNLADENEKILFIVSDKYKKVEPEKVSILSDYDGLLETTTKYSLNPEILDRLGDTISKIIMDSKLISDEDKKNLLISETVTTVKKGTIDRLLQYDDPALIFELIEPVLSLK
jgi:hypothetical protein